MDPNWLWWDNVSTPKGEGQMKIRELFAIAATLTLAALPAHAAITVLGNTLAHNCFEAAEFGGNPNEGIAMCTSALSGPALSTADRAATLVNRGILKSRDEDPNGALDDYNRGLSLDANLGEGYVDRGATYIVMQRYNDALTDINKGIALGAKKPEIAYYDRAIVDEAMGDVRSAYQDYRKAVELEPDFTLATEQLARFKVIRKSPNGT
jgi:tetratricopeptide (TPR) repeat protein